MFAPPQSPSRYRNPRSPGLRSPGLLSPGIRSPGLPGTPYRVVHPGIDRVRYAARSPSPRRRYSTHSNDDDVNYPTLHGAIAFAVDELATAANRSVTSFVEKRRSGPYSAVSQRGDTEDDLTKKPLNIRQLPAEIQLMVMSYLGFGDMERLRRTCQFYHLFLTPDYLRSHFGGDKALASQLVQHCQGCLEAPGRNGLILVDSSQALGSKCFRCAIMADRQISSSSETDPKASRMLRVGTQLTFASRRRGWVCRWCGWPVIVGRDSSIAHEQFHYQCYARYYKVLWLFMAFGFAQFAIGVTAGTLALRYYRDVVVVFAPSVVSSKWSL